MIITGTATLIIYSKTQDSEGIWVESNTNPIRYNYPCNFQNRSSEGINYAEYGINQSSNPKYVFIQGVHPEIIEGEKIINDSTGKVYEIKKVFDGYTDHMELIVVPVTGG